MTQRDEDMVMLDLANWGHIGATPLAGPLLMLMLARIPQPHDDMQNTILDRPLL